MKVVIFSLKKKLGTFWSRLCIPASSQVIVSSPFLLQSLNSSVHEAAYRVTAAYELNYQGHVTMEPRDVLFHPRDWWAKDLLFIQLCKPPGLPYPMQCRVYGTWIELIQCKRKRMSSLWQEKEQLNDHEHYLKTWLPKRESCRFCSGEVNC